MNIILIVIDTLRADHLGCYGYGRNTSPRIDELAQDGVRFASCYSQAPWTIPSFTTIMTGMFPEAHRVAASPWNVPNANRITLDDRVPVLAELLLDAGYVTAAFDNLHQMASHPKWFVRGYNYYVNATPRTGLFHHHVRADHINAQLEPWLESHRRDKFFAFVHYWEPHTPYNQPSPFDTMFPAEIDLPTVATPDGGKYVPGWGRRETLNARTLRAIAGYDGEIRFVDEYVGRVVGMLQRLGLWDDTLLIISGDHGECMTEHGVLFEHLHLYEPTVHVPLIFAGPQTRGAGKVVDSLVQHTDILPTVLDLIGVPIPPTVDGQSLKGHLNGSPDAPTRRQVHALQDGKFPTRMLRTRDWKLIHRYQFSEGARREMGIGRELYSLADDPYELRNVADSQPAVVRRLEVEMGEWLKQVLSPHGGIDPLQAEELTVDFNQYPGDPVLADFYRWVSGEGD